MFNGVDATKQLFDWCVGRNGLVMVELQRGELCSDATLGHDQHWLTVEQHSYISPSSNTYLISLLTSSTPRLTDYARFVFPALRESISGICEEELGRESHYCRKAFEVSWAPGTMARFLPKDSIIAGMHNIGTVFEPDI